MRKIVSVLLIIACVITFGACAKKNPQITETTPTPEVNTQGGDTVESVGDAQQGTENNGDGSENSLQPVSTTDPGVDLEEDILTEDDVTTPAPDNSTAQATPKADQGSNDNGNSDTAPAATETPTVITLPFDKF